MQVEIWKGQSGDDLKKKKLMYLFIFWPTGSLVEAYGGPFSGGVWSSELMGSVTVARAHCSQACGILISQPGIEPMSSTLESGFIATELPESPHDDFLKNYLWNPNDVST